MAMSRSIAVFGSVLLGGGFVAIGLILRRIPSKLRSDAHLDHQGREPHVEQRPLLRDRAPLLLIAAVAVITGITLIFSSV